jgi:hypothetical protein
MSRTLTGRRLILSVGWGGLDGQGLAPVANHAVGERVQRLDAAPVFTAQGAQREEQVVDEPRTSTAFHRNLPDSVSFKMNFNFGGR